MKDAMSKYLIALLLLAGVATVDAQTPRRKEVPDYIKFRILCDQGYSFEAEAARKSPNDRTASGLWHGFKDLFQLNEDDEAILRTIVTECGEQLGKLKTLSLETAKRQGPTPSDGPLAPQQSAELREIQQRKIAVALHARDRLQAELSRAAYLRIESYLNEHVRSGAVGSTIDSSATAESSR